MSLSKRWIPHLFRKVRRKENNKCEDLNKNMLRIMIVI